MALSCTKGGLYWILWRISSFKGWPGIGRGCPEKWCNHHLWKCSKNMWLQHLGAWFSGEHSGVRLTVVLCDLTGFFQPQTSYNSVILTENCRKTLYFTFRIYTLAENTLSLAHCVLWNTLGLCGCITVIKLGKKL